MKNLHNLFKKHRNQIFICGSLLVLIQNSSLSQTCSGTFVITAANDQSAMFGTGFSNTTVYITSDFYITNTFTISGCNVIIDPTVRIIVQAGKQLNITNGTTQSHLYACTKMWDGITIEGSTLFGNGLLRINNNTLIEDAEHAVYIPNTSSGQFRIQNSTFNKNWIHILIDHVPGTQYVGASSLDYSNFFCKDLTTNIYSNLIIPHNTSRTFQAISYKSAGAGLYMTIGSGNVVENADVGVYNYNSHTDVIDSYIHDCDIGYYGAWDGTMKLFNSEVRNCTIGVESTLSMAYVEIRQNQIFRISNKGIFVHANRAELQVFKNTMYEILDAIVILDNNNNVNIHDNDIYNGLVSSFPGSHAVFVQQPIPYPDITLNITANELAQFEQGVFVSTFDNTTVRGNYIDMDFIIPGLSYQIFAIKIENSDYFGVAVNTIKGNTTAANYCDVNTSGVFIENCNEGGVICNEFGDPAILTQFTFNKNLLMEGVVNKDFIGGNKFRFEHLWSLYIRNSAGGLGIQGDAFYVTDNEWYLYSGSSQCSNFTEDIISENSHSSNNTQFNVRAGIPFEHDLPIALTGISALANAVSTAPMPNTLCTFLRFSDGNLENSIADGSAFNSNSSEAYKWYSQNWLYRVIPIYAIYSNSFYSNFYSTLNNGNYGALNNFCHQFSANSILGGSISAANFIPQNVVENNIKKVIDIKAQIHNQGIHSISIAQKNTIDSLSVLCPQVDGPGVYMARACRALFDNQLYEYSNLCSNSIGNNQRIQKSENSVQTAKVMVENNEFKIISENSEFFTLTIFDLSGKIVFSDRVNSDNSISGHLIPGIYMYILSSENNNSLFSRGKISIMK